MRIRIASIIACLVSVASFATEGHAQSEEDQIRAVLNGGCKSYLQGDMSADGAMRTFRSGTKLMVFDFSPPRSKNYAQMKNDNMDLAKPIACNYLEINPVLLGKGVAYSTAIMHAAGILKNGQKVDFTIRETDVWKKTKGRWYAIHEHNSFPVNVLTGQADLQSTP